MIDVGANIGNHAIYLSPSFSRIHCFEPSPEIADRLAHNIALNGLSNIEIHRAGLSDRGGLLHFKLELGGNLGASHFVERPDEDTVPLPVHRGDDFLSGMDRIDFIKVDAERHEREVFAGLRDIIARYRPIVAFELHGGEGIVYFDSITSCLPNYIITEPIFAPWRASALEKFVWQIWGQITFLKVTAPEPRFYENLIAFPSDATLSSFTTASHPRNS